MTHTRRRFLRTVGATGAAATLASLAGCSDDGGGGGNGGGGNGGGGNGGGDGGNVVEMTDDLTFQPESITVSTGETVTWDNVGGVGHTVTAYGDQIPSGADYFASGGFDSEDAARDGYAQGQQGNVPGGESYEHTFETAGTYEYFCIPHESADMVGTVEVTESG